MPAKKKPRALKPSVGKLGHPRSEFDSRWYRQYEKGNPFKGAIRKKLPKSRGEFSPAYQLVVEFNYRCKKARQGSWKSVGYSKPTRDFDERHLEGLIYQAWSVAKWSKPINYTCDSDQLVIIGEPTILGFIYYYRGTPEEGKNSKESAPKLKVFKEYQAELPSESIPAEPKKKRKVKKSKQTVALTRNDKTVEYELVTRRKPGKRVYKYLRALRRK